jgi:Uma2 family endonuclease
MSELAIRRMTLDEFLRWEDGTDTRYELLDGFPIAMAPPARAHGVLYVKTRSCDRRRFALATTVHGTS